MSDLERRTHDEAGNKYGELVPTPPQSPTEEERRWATYDCQNPLHVNCVTDGVNHMENLTAEDPSTAKEVKVGNDELTELLVWAYKQGFLDATQALTDSLKSLDDAKIRAQLLAGLESLSNPAAPAQPKAEGSE